MNSALAVTSTTTAVTRAEIAILFSKETPRAPTLDPASCLLIRIPPSAAMRRRIRQTYSRPGPNGSLPGSGH